MAENDDPASGSGASGGSDDTEPVIVAIGASAGGIHALQTLFAAVPERTGAAFIVVAHLEPVHRGALAGIIGSRTKMPIVPVGERCRLEADRVYIIPPDHSLQIENREIIAVEFGEPRGQRFPIDHALRAAVRQLADGFAIILSGTGADGVLGVRAVKEAGGIVLVQDPNEAEYPSMPNNAIATRVADFVLPAHDLGMRLVDLIRIKAAVHPAEIRHFDEEQLRRALAYLRIRTGHDFSKYKRSTVLRRMARRMQVVGAHSVAEYEEILRNSAEEAQALLGDLLVSVTTFFRDGAVFQRLAQDVLPELFDEKTGDQAIRVWVPGCATGEEAYSLAILLLEEASRHWPRRAIQVFGSDLDARALAGAREGRFPLSVDADIGEERLRRFFRREGDYYRVRQEVRDLVLFAAHDLLRDPPFLHIDLISCRNVLIYFDRESQEQVCNTFHHALNPGRYLLLGASETADNSPGLFRSIDLTARVYQSTTIPGDLPRPSPRPLGPLRVREPAARFDRAVTPTVALGEAAMHRRALEQLAPPSVLVDESHRVVHLSENAGRFILPSGGPLSGDAVDLVRPELRPELRAALNRAFEQNQQTLSSPVLVRFDGTARRVHLMVRPLPENHGAPATAVVMFIEGDAVDQTPAAEGPVNDEALRRLAQELDLAQTRLRRVREESDAANEELRAANEELQSINEEYRLTSEELETSKEELQAINEELRTVNSELKLKLETISRAHSDLQNLIAATDFGTLFLDAGLRIKRFTEAVTGLFSITQADERRPITDFAHQLQYDDLAKDAQAVLTNLAPIRREVRSRGGCWYDMRIRPYRTMDGAIDGVVITFVDISERRALEATPRSNL